MPAKYAYRYREGAGYLHVKPLGDGTQGSVSLVRSLRSNRLYVRKAGLYQPSYTFDPSDPLGEWCPEHHPHNSKIHATMIIGYANGGDLRKLFYSFNDLELMVPEYLIWLYLQHMLTALHYLHRECSPAITHNDFFSGNVLVSWPKSTTDATSSLLPKFLLSDLGISEAHPFLDPSDQSDSEVELARIGFSQDYDDLSATTYFLMTGDEQDRRGEKEENQEVIREEYSTELVGVAKALFKYAEDVMDDSRVNLNKLRAFVAEKVQTMKLGSWDREVLKSFRNTMVKINEPDPEPLLFDSYNALMNHVPRPAGPWDVVRVDPVSYEVLETVSYAHCASRVQLTDRDGIAVRANGTKKVGRDGDLWNVTVSSEDVAMIQQGDYSEEEKTPSTTEMFILDRDMEFQCECPGEVDDQFTTVPEAVKVTKLRELTPKTHREKDGWTRWIREGKEKFPSKVTIPLPGTRGTVEGRSPVEQFATYPARTKVIPKL